MTYHVRRIDPADGVETRARTGVAVVPVNEDSKMKQMAKLAVLVLVCMGFLTACNTVAGAGKDIKRAGEKIEGAAGK